MNRFKNLNQEQASIVAQNLSFKKLKELAIQIGINEVEEATHEQLITEVEIVLESEYEVYKRENKIR